MKKLKNNDLKEIINVKEIDIDYSDIPETNYDFWADSEVKYFTNKVDYTIKIDEDLAIWLKKIGSSSHDAVNNIIRAYYLVNS